MHIENATARRAVEGFRAKPGDRAREICKHLLKAPRQPTYFLPPADGRPARLVCARCCGFRVLEMVAAFDVRAI